MKISSIFPSAKRNVTETKGGVVLLRLKRRLEAGDVVALARYFATTVIGAPLCGPLSRGCGHHRNSYAEMDWAPR